MGFLDIVCYNGKNMQDEFAGDTFRYDEDKNIFRLFRSNIKVPKSNREYFNSIEKVTILSREDVAKRVILPRDLLPSFKNLEYLEISNICNLWKIEDGALAKNPKLKAIEVAPSRDGQSELTIKLLSRYAVFTDNTALPYERTDTNKISVISYDIDGYRCNRQQTELAHYLSFDWMNKEL